MIIPEMMAPGGPHLNAILLDWCAQRLSVTFMNGSVAMGVARDDPETGATTLLAVAVYDNFRRGPTGKPLNIECSIAADSPRWITKGTVRAILHYPFCQLGVQRVTAMVSEKNARSIKFLNGLGFVREGFIRDALEDCGMYVTGMLREEARRWLGDLLDG